MEIFIKYLKKGSEFTFNNKTFKVKQRFSDWKKDDNPYLVTECGEIFWFDELIVNI